MALGWFSSTTHLSTLSVLQGYFKEWSALSDVRVAGMLVTLPSCSSVWLWYMWIKPFKCLCNAVLSTLYGQREELVVSTSSSLFCCMCIFLWSMSSRFEDGTLKIYANTELDHKWGEPVSWLGNTRRNIGRSAIIYLSLKRLLPASISYTWNSASHFYWKSCGCALISSMAFVNSIGQRSMWETKWSHRNARTSGDLGSYWHFCCWLYLYWQL